MYPSLSGPCVLQRTRAGQLSSSIVHDSRTRLQSVGELCRGLDAECRAILAWIRGRKLRRGLTGQVSRWACGMIHLESRSVGAFSAEPNQVSTAHLVFRRWYGALTCEQPLAQPWSISSTHGLSQSPVATNGRCRPGGGSWRMKKSGHTGNTMEPFPLTSPGHRCPRGRGRGCDRLAGRGGGLARMGNASTDASRVGRRLSDTLKQSRQKYEWVRHLGLRTIVRLCDTTMDDDVAHGR